MTVPAGATTLADLQAPVQAELEQVRDELRRLIEADFGLIAEVNTHLLQMQGKMFRPALVLLANAATGQRNAKAVSLAAVVELIHLATLVHDDSVDHSVLRRGMPTINALFSHQVSVIMGDYLYSRAVIELVRQEDLLALRVLSRVTNEMTVGEMRQLLAHDPLRFSEEDYDLLIRSKTASLMSGACEVGALAASTTEREAMGRFGYHLGMAFQIVDDLLDFTADAEDTGKPSGLDLREHKVTLPLIHALPRMSAGQRRTVETLMASPEPSDLEIEAVIAAVGRCGGLDYARGRAQQFMDAAESDLEQLEPGPARETLRSSLGYVLDRRR
ncbi:MAG: polyprenyl synthetase family protein [Gemmatimonadota bacterium]|nr:polyprenyl synthetase family protein [Gemmatimonadota bacterium]